MFMAVGHPVLKLKRIAFGPVHMEDLPPGKFRYLNEEEVDRLRKIGSSHGESRQSGRTR